MSSPRHHDGRIWSAASKRPTRGDVQMIHKFLRRAGFAVATCCSTALLAASATNAAGYSAEYVFGDSLSDNGNLAELLSVVNFAENKVSLGNFPNPPSFHDAQ